MNRNRKDPLNKVVGKLAAKAYSDASDRAFKSGEIVLFAKEGHLCEYNPDKKNSKKFKKIKHLAKRVSIKEEYIVL